MPQSTVKNLDLASSLTVDDPTKALRLVDDYLKNDPLNSSAILTKYHAQQNLGLWSDALDTAGKLANVSSDKSLCYLLQADMLYHLGWTITCLV
jgi:hypothetical protein